MTSKRSFRPSTAESPRYPDQHEGEPVRRRLLARLGLGLIAAGSLAALLTACEPDTHQLGGSPDGRHAPIDAGIDVRTMGGVPDHGDAPGDARADTEGVDQRGRPRIDSARRRQDGSP